MSDDLSQPPSVDSITWKQVTHSKSVVMPEFGPRGSLVIRTKMENSIDQRDLRKTSLKKCLWNRERWIRMSSNGHGARRGFQARGPNVVKASKEYSLFEIAGKPLWYQTRSRVWRGSAATETDPECTGKGFR